MIPLLCLALAALAGTWSDSYELEARGDYSGAINLYADGSDEAQAEWKNGLLDTYEIKDVFDPAMLRRFKLLKMPEFFDNKN